MADDDETYIYYVAQTNDAAFGILQHLAMFSELQTNSEIVILGSFVEAACTAKDCGLDRNI